MCYTEADPCRNTGDNSVVTATHDIEGDPRIVFGIVDMGSDEFQTNLSVMEVK